MLIVDKDNYKKYLNGKDVKSTWKKRDFVSEVEKYFDSCLQKVLIISGLRGTGKSVGILQAMEGRNAVYLLAEKGKDRVSTADEVMNIINSRSEKYILLDEYTWIEGRKESDLDAYLDTLTNHGKKVVVTGTESISLEALKSGALIHRAVTIHTTHMSFSEYCKLYDMPMNQKSCDKYLTEGGIFEEYVINNEQSMTDYIETAIIDNLRNYVKNTTSLVDESKISTIIYTLFYQAIWDILKEDIKYLSTTQESLAAMDRFGIDPDNRIVNPREVELVSNILEQVGVIIKVPNLLPRKSKLDESGLKTDYRTYIVNPSLTWQFIKAVFPDYKDYGGRIGAVYEANCVVDLAFSKLECDNIYFIQSNEGNNYEIDIAIVQNDDLLKKRIYLFECKHDAAFKIFGKNISLVNGKVDHALLEEWPDAEIIGRYVVHPGECSCQQHDSGEEII